jgi:hypothetical protein
LCKKNEGSFWSNQLLVISKTRFIRMGHASGGILYQKLNGRKKKLELLGWLKREILFQPWPPSRALNLLWCHLEANFLQDSEVGSSLPKAWLLAEEVIFPKFRKGDISTSL